MVGCAAGGSTSATSTTTSTTATTSTTTSTSTTASTSTSTSTSAASALKPNSISDAPDNEAPDMRKLFEFAKQQGAAAVTTGQLHQHDVLGRGGADGNPGTGTLKPQVKPSAAYLATRRGALTMNAERAVAAAGAAVNANEVVCQGMRHVLGVMSTDGAWKKARLALRDLNTRLRLFTIRWGKHAWSPAGGPPGRELALKDLCATEECSSHATSRMYAAWEAQLAKTCAAGASTLNYCCTRMVSDDDNAVCASKACKADEADATSEEARGKDGGVARNANAVAVLGAMTDDAPPDMDEVLASNILPLQVKAEEALAAVPLPSVLSDSERELVGRFKQQIREATQGLNAIATATSAEVSRAAEFAHHYELNLRAWEPRPVDGAQRRGGTAADDEPT